MSLDIRITKKVFDDLAMAIIPQIVDEVKAWQCKACSFLSTDLVEAVNHFSQKHLGTDIEKQVDTVKCENMQTENLKDKYHENVQNDTIELPTEGVGGKDNYVTKVMFMCSVCHTAHPSVDAIRKHVAIEHGKQIKKGEANCKNSKTNIRRVEKKVECSVCHLVLASRKILKRHLRAVHYKIKPHVCAVCGHSTALKHSLELHVRQHTDERPYACPDCSYRARDPNTMRRHRTRHNRDE